MSNHMTCKPRVKARAGFTLVEVMVAMMIMTIGLLGLASTSAVVVRQMGDAGRMGVAASVAQSRIEKLRLATCTASSTGTSTARGVSETWTITPQVRSARIDVTITYATRRGMRSQSYRSTVPCI
jgi:prepilin-type N-terminal cleavage/methylation domain-containing protein